MPKVSQIRFPKVNQTQVKLPLTSYTRSLQSERRDSSLAGKISQKLLTIDNELDAMETYGLTRTERQNNYLKKRKGVANLPQIRGSRSVSDRKQNNNVLHSESLYY